MTLTDFLLARIAEDEAVAIRLCPGRSPDNGHWIATSLEFSGVHDRPTTKHIVRHDPSRVLAECAAKRLIVAEHAPMPCENERHQHGLHCAVCEYDVISRGWHPCPTLRFLALPYADHSDYLPEWRP